MRFLTAIMLASFSVAGCKTPPPPKDDSFEDDHVEVDGTDNDTPDMGQAPIDADRPAVDEEPVTKKPSAETHETFVPEPKLPDDMSYGEITLARTIEVYKAPLRFAPVIESARCGIPDAIHASAGEGSGFAVESCARVIAAAHAKTNHRTVTQLGVIDASLVEIRHDGQIVWSVAPICVELRQDEQACRSDFTMKLPTVASFAGPLLSYKVQTTEARAGGPASSEFSGFVVDVRTGRPARFGAMIDEDSLIDGLKRHSHMRRAVNPVELDKAKSLDEIWALWRTQDFGFFGAYYFGEWDANNGLVAMHIWYREDTADDQPNDLKRIQVWVRPKRTWRAAFEDAAAGTSGFLAR